MTNRARRGVLFLRVGLGLGLLASVASAAPRKRKPPAPPITPAPVTPAVAPAAATAPTSGSVPVSVIEVAGESAYLQPGASGGVYRGAHVTIRGHEYTVLASTAAFATVDATAQPLHEQERGMATVVDAQATRGAQLVPPHALQSFNGLWPVAEPPADTQVVKLVPLSSSENRDGRWDVRLSSTVGAILPLSDNTLDRSRNRAVGVASAEIDARVHAEPITAPLAIDVDAAVQRWFGPGLGDRLGDDSRPTLRVRELQLGYGRAGSWYGALGRMRYAAATLGALDGARLRAPLGSKLSVGAFGGAVPNPLNEGVSTAAQRFGVEANYSDVEAPWHPEAAIVVQGSTFEGKLDERRLMGVLGLFPGDSRLGGHFELSAFDKSNPWRVAPIELTAAGLDASVRAGPFQFGARADLRQQDRSRWLASFLPASWFCTPTPQVPAAAPVGAPAAPLVPEPCADPGATRYLGSLDASLELGKLSLMSGATIIRDPGGASQLGGFLHGRLVRIVRSTRIDASASYSEGTFLDMYGGSLGPGVSLFRDTLDASVYYRISVLRYRAVDQTLAQQAIGTTLMLLPSSDLFFTLQGEAMGAADADALIVFLSALWRPRL